MLSGVKTMYLGNTERVVAGAVCTVADLIEQILVPGLMLTHYLNTVYTWTYYPSAVRMLEDERR